MIKQTPFYTTEDNCEFRIAVECDGANSRCEFTLYRTDGDQVIFRCPGVIGKNGVGKKTEGDMKTPLGTFVVGNAYGIEDNPGSIIPYTKITEDMYWRGDAAKADYNTLAYASKLPPDTDLSNDEHLIDYGGVYNYLLDIGYNRDCMPYAGSAVFLHCWRDKDTPTSGCIAIAEGSMIRTLRTITPGTQITIY